MTKPIDIHNLHNTRESFSDIHSPFALPSSVLFVPHITRTTPNPQSPIQPKGKALQHIQFLLHELLTILMPIQISKRERDTERGV